MNTLKPFFKNYNLIDIITILTSIILFILGALFYDLNNIGLFLIAFGIIILGIYGIIRKHMYFKNIYIKGSQAVIYSIIITIFGFMFLIYLIYKLYIK